MARIAVRIPRVTGRFDNISIFLNRTAVRSSGQRGTEKAVDDRAVRLRLPREFLNTIL